MMISIINISYECSMLNCTKYFGNTFNKAIYKCHNISYLILQVEELCSKLAVYVVQR